ASVRGDLISVGWRIWPKSLGTRLRGCDGWGARSASNLLSPRDHRGAIDGPASVRRDLISVGWRMRPKPQGTAFAGATVGVRALRQTSCRRRVHPGAIAWTNAGPRRSDFRIRAL